MPRQSTTDTYARGFHLFSPKGQCVSPVARRVPAVAVWYAPMREWQEFSRGLGDLTQSNPSYVIAGESTQSGPYTGRLYVLGGPNFEGAAGLFNTGLNYVPARPVTALGLRSLRPFSTADRDGYVFFSGRDTSYHVQIVAPLDNEPIVVRLVQAELPSDVDFPAADVVFRRIETPSARDEAVGIYASIQSEYKRPRPSWNTIASASGRLLERVLVERLLPVMDSNQVARGRLQDLIAQAHERGVLATHLYQTWAETVRLTSNRTHATRQLREDEDMRPDEGRTCLQALVTLLTRMAS